MPLAIDSLEREGPVTDEAVDRFIASHQFPLIEGGSATFVFRGAVDEVNLRH